MNAMQGKLREYRVDLVDLRTGKVVAESRVMARTETQARRQARACYKAFKKRERAS